MDNQRKHRSMNTGDEQSLSTKGILKSDSKHVNSHPNKIEEEDNRQNISIHAFSQPLPVLPTNPGLKPSIVDSQQKNNRRVSFAPDVTLHSFDAVPQQGSQPPNIHADETNETMGMDLTEPFQASTQRDDKDGDDVPEVNESMDITGVYTNESSAKTKNNIHAVRTEDKDEDMSMDLTTRQEQLTPILLPVDNINNRANETSAGNIITETHTEIQIQNGNTEEEPMELTEVMSLPLSQPHDNIIQDSASIKGIRNSTLGSQPTSSTQVPKSNYPMDDVSSAMDLTQPQTLNKESISDTSVMEFTSPQVTSQTSADESVAMEFTQVQKSVVNTNDNSPEKDSMQNQDSKTTTDDTSLTMDLTHIGSSVNDTKTQTRHNSSVIPPQKPKQMRKSSEYIGVHDNKPRPESKIPQPSSIPRIIRKRQRLREPIKPIEQFVHNTTPPNKRARPNQTNSDISEMEKMSPIRIEEYNTFDKTTENNIEEYNPQNDFSLTSFIKETDVGFLTDIDILKNDSKTISFTSVADTEALQFKIQSLYNALYNEIPIIQMNNFIIKELKSISEQSSKSFNDLDRQIQESSNHPLLLLDYSNSDERTKQKMKEQLQLVKYYSKLKARKSFGQWYLSQLHNLSEVLKENKSFLLEEYKSVESTLDQVRQIHQKVTNLKILLKKELTLLKTSPIGDSTDDGNIKRKIRLAWLRKELQSHKISTDNLLELQTKKQELSRVLNTREAQLQRLNSEVIRATFSSKSSSEGEMTSNYVTESLSLMGTITGVKITSFCKSKISIIIQGEPEFHVELNFAEGANRVITLLSSDYGSEILPKLLAQIEQDFHSTNRSSETNGASSLILRMRRLLLVLKEFRMLNALFPTDVLENGDIRFYDCNPALNDEVIFIIPLTEFVNSVNASDRPVTLTVKAIRGKDIAPEDISARLTNKIQKLLPSLMNHNINMQLE